MKKKLGHPVADGFLRDVERESRALPRRRRAELLGDLEAHLREAVERSGGDEASLRDLVDALGSPTEIVAAAAPADRPARLAGRDLAAVLLLLLGGFVAFVGWFAGVVLLWASPAWSARQKLLGTLVFPLGLAFPFVLWIVATSDLTTTTCGGKGQTGCSDSSGLSALTVAALIATAVVAVAGPIATSIYLARSASRSPA